MSVGCMKKFYQRFAIAGISAVALAVLLEAWFLEKYFFAVKHFSIGRRDSDKKIKILLITDIHFKKKLWPFHYRLAQKINKINPELLLIAGDIIDQYGEATPARKFFPLLKRTIPKIAIQGNHDHRNNVSTATLKEIFSKNNGHLLINETIQLHIKGNVFTITGLDDFIEGYSRFPEAVSHVKREPNHLMLVHSPYQQEYVLQQMNEINKNREYENQLNIQYIFAGHNHGGQVRLGSIVPVLPEGSGDYINGWYNKEKPYLYVSKGFGTSGIPFRFGARSEIIVFNYNV
jgi:predicted MPP superfamily phosphohydrolase